MMSPLSHGGCHNLLLPIGLKRENRKRFLLVCMVLSVSLLLLLNTHETKNLLRLRYQDEGKFAILAPFPENPEIREHDDHPFAVQLNVPFFVYENELDWSTVTPFHKSFIDKKYKQSKHSDDFWFMMNAFKHPFRTHDPEQAKLFFVPSLLNMASREGRLSPLFREVCQHKNVTDCFAERHQAYHFVDCALASSKYYQRSNGKDHVIVASHWTFRPNRWCNIEGPKNYTHINILNCNLINFEGYIGGSHLSSPSMYIGNPCPASQEKLFDFAFIASLHPKKPEFQTRRNICDWLQSGNHSVSLCGEGDQCQHLSNAKYGFHARGDTWGSNRLMDTLQSRTVPLFTDEEQYRVLPKFVPWRSMSYLVNMTTQESFQQSLEYILSRPHSEYEQMQRLIGEYLHIFDHKDVYQFDAYMADFASRLGFQR